MKPGPLASLGLAFLGSVAPLAAGTGRDAEAGGAESARMVHSLVLDRLGLGETVEELAQVASSTGYLGLALQRAIAVWRVGHDCQVEVRAGSGELVSVNYSGKLRRIKGGAVLDKVSAVQSISDASAAARGLVEVLVGDLPEDTRLDEARFDDMLGAWVVGWHRYAGGLQWADETIAVHMEGNGRTSFRLWWSMTRADFVPPATQITRGHALKVAESYLSRRTELKLGPDYARSCSTLGEPIIVYASGMLSPESWGSQDFEPRAVFSVRCEFTYVGSAAVHIDQGPIVVWVDVGNGEVVGGYM